MTANHFSRKDLTGYGATDVTIRSTAFVAGDFEEMFLNQSSACVDAGIDVAADHATNGFTAMGLPDWAEMTTRFDGALDSGTADTGMHYAAP